MGNESGGAGARGTTHVLHSAPLRLGWLVVGVAFLLHVREWAFLCDDAFISFRYAQNLARHGELVFNVDPIEYVEGYTNLSWVLLLALGDAVGIAPPSLAPALTAVSAMASLVLITWLVRRLREQTGAVDPVGLSDLIPAAILVALPEFVVWGSGGLETSFALALGLGAMVAWTHGRIELAAGLATFAGLTRLDSLVVIGSFGVAWLVVFGIQRARRSAGLELAELPWRRLALGATVFGAPLLLQFVWRHAYYGQWLPNTWAVKQHGALLRDTVGADYVASWVENVGLWWLLPLLVLLRLRHVLLAAPALAMVGYAWSVGGDFMAYSRFLLPATGLLAGLVGWSLADLEIWAARRVDRRVPVALILGLAWVGVLAWRVPARVALDHDKAWIPAQRGDEKGRWEGVRAMDRFARVRVAAGAWMRDNLPPDTRVSVGAAGAMPYASGLPTFDAYGLVDPGVLAVAKPATGASARPGHQLHAPLSYIKSREPDLMCHIGHAGPREPPARAARQRAGRGYVWACIELGTIEGGREPLDAGYYCCLRQRDHVVGPFGAGGGT